MNALEKRKDNYKLRKRYNENKNKKKLDYLSFYEKDEKRIKRNCHKFKERKKFLKYEERRYNRRNKNYFDEENLSLTNNFYHPKKYINGVNAKKNKYRYAYNMY